MLAGRDVDWSRCWLVEIFRSRPFLGADLQIGLRGSEDPRPGALRSEDRTQRGIARSVTSSSSELAGRFHCLSNPIDREPQDFFFSCFSSEKG